MRSESQPKRSKRRFQVGLRMLLAFTAIAAFFLAWISSYLHRQSDEAEAIATLQKVSRMESITFGFDYQTWDMTEVAYPRVVKEVDPSGPLWIRSWLGKHIFSHVESVLIYGIGPGSQEIFRQLARFRHLKHLTIESYWSDGSEDFSVLSNLESLRTIPARVIYDESLLSPNYYQFDLAEIDGLTKLRVLSIDKMLVSPNAHLLGQFSNMEKLELGVSTNIKSAACFSAMSKLKTLRIDGVPNLRSLEGIEGLSSLESLGLGQCYRVESLAPLAKLASLKQLSLSLLYNTSELEALTKLSNLESIRLSGDFTSDQVDALKAALAHVETVKLFSVSREPAVAPVIRRSSTSNAKLRWLHVSGAKGIEALNQIPRDCPLRSLSISDCDASELAKLSGEFENLAELTLRNCRFKDLPVIHRQDNLLTFKIQNCAEVESFEGFEHLSTLEIESCPDLKLLSAARMQDSLSSLKVTSCKSLAAVTGLGPSKILTSIELSNCPSLTKVQQIGNMPTLMHLNLEGCTQLLSLGKVGGLPKLRELRVGKSEVLQNTDFENDMSINGVWIDQFSNWDHLDGIRTFYVDCLDARGLTEIGDVSELVGLMLRNASDLQSASSLAEAKRISSLRIDGADQLESIPPLDHLQITNLQIIGDKIQCENWRDGFQKNMNEPSLGFGGILADQFLAADNNVGWITEFEIDNANSLSDLSQLLRLKLTRQLKVVDCQQLKSIKPLTKDVTTFDSLWLESCIGISDLELLSKCDWLSSLTIAGSFSSDQLNEVRFPSNVDTIRFKDCHDLFKLDRQLTETFTLKKLEVNGCVNLTRLAIPSHMVVECVEISKCPSISSDDIDAIQKLGTQVYVK